ncbi:peptidase S8/S53 domain-containing protein [Epithele typhae]|uniref:peptidase S8/S53 domain-containing protein n=1 Tax=Epithele typhae TaxID=378194 RepID=UPI0020079EA9|nr:peptidase S8/S53 domain-containing protein [Epithele typhae]KAH9923428.1 peptidase S8/S53 domain-containing protein [Epithele typhae]
MHARSVLLLAIAAAVLSPSTGTLISPQVVHERRDSIPRGWSLQRRADPDLILPHLFALAQPNVDNLEAFLLDVSDPSSPNYGKHWTQAKVSQTFRPTAETVDTVHAWLTGSAGIDSSRVRLTKNDAYIEVNVTIAEAEALLGTQYFVYQHEHGSIHVACGDRYHLPAHVSKHVDTVWPTFHFDAMPRSRRRNTRPETLAGSTPIARPFNQTLSPLTESDGLSSCWMTTTLDCLRALYNFTYELTVPEKHSMGIVEFGTETLSYTDLDAFFQAYAPSMVGTRPTWVGLDGGTDLLIEPNLDFQYAMGLLGGNVNMLQYQVTNDGPYWAYLNIDYLMDAIDGDYCTFEGGDPPFLSTGPGNRTNGAMRWSPARHVVSVSYLQAEFAFGDFYATRMCTEFGKLALMGTTVIFSSGDNGVASLGGSCGGDNNTDFYPQIANTCPYVLSVGATQIIKNHQVTDPEEATSAVFKSGGGFSNYIPRPSFQDAAVQNFIENYAGDVPDGVYNKSGRAYPDVSANGYNYRVYINGEPNAVFGTSASAPVWGAFLTAVNDARIAAGKSPVGWVHPALYSDAFAGVWHDVTLGDNKACGVDRTLGFTAAPGWDPITGLGTPDVGKLIEAWLALP